MRRTNGEGEREKKGKEKERMRKQDGNIVEATTIVTTAA